MHFFSPLSRVSWPQHMSTVAFSPAVSTQAFFSSARHAGIHGQAKCLQASQSFILERGKLNLQRELKVDPQDVRVQTLPGWTRRTWTPHVRRDLLRRDADCDCMRSPCYTRQKIHFNSNLPDKEQQYINITMHGVEKWLSDHKITESENEGFGESLYNSIRPCSLLNKLSTVCMWLKNKALFGLMSS